ncbi:M48 family metallopeptidase [Thermophagus sp. OGC60D27]|uniref:M48 family metallopeptidase n=1 Tax=Thermophagus sp. OGC60D27 TaxID=3458415 RepID=UPI004037DABB
MKKMNYLLSFISIVTAVIVVSCSTVPITGRKQMNLLPESEIMAMSFSQYEEFLSQNNLSKDKETTEMVKRVGQRIANAVETYFKNHGMSDRLANFAWEFNLVDDDTPNAWCMPGGKVVVYTGILPVTQDETGLAVVMGHEIAHAVARHGNERMSQQLAVQGLGTAISVALDEKPEQTKNIFLAAYGIGSQVVYTLPYSRTHETEADKMGLIFMAMAGYNPREAVNFWKRMSQLGGQKPPEFLSTHPADETRAKNLNDFMPEALKYYNPPQN